MQNSVYVVIRDLFQILLNNGSNFPCLRVNDDLKQVNVENVETIDHFYY